MRHSIRELQQTSWRSGRKRRPRDRRPTVESLEGRALLSTAHHRVAPGHALAAEAKKAPTGFQQINLVSDLSSEGASIVDSNLKNPWGMAYAPVSPTSPTGSPFWISDAATGVTTIYKVTSSNVVTASTGFNGGDAVKIPGATASSSGSPTGQVLNSTTSFVLSNGKPASFIFDTIQGTIAAWNSGSGTAAVTKVNSSTAEYTGLAIGSNGGQNYLYAANTRSTSGIEVYDGSFNNVTSTTFAGKFVDPKLKKGFVKSLTPYNITNIGGQLYVTYVGPNLRGGAVAVFNTDGTFVRQIAANGNSGNLQAPWGVSMAPSSFGKFSNDLLVGNFGNGRIDAYNAKGKFAGQLTSNGHKPLVIPGLWALGVGNGGSAGSSSLVYFTAGINGQSDGLFGALQPSS
jgi:uncharacterized protein (TIGR03118 family)